MLPTDLIYPSFLYLVLNSVDLYMKNTLFCLLLIFAVTEAGLAQTEKGTQYLGIGLSAGITTDRSTGFDDRTVRDVGFSISPGYSYFIADGWELRGAFGVGMSKRRTKSDDVVRKSNSHSLAPLIGIRRHLMVSEKLGFAAGPYVFYAYGKNEYPDSDHSIFEQFETGIDLQIEYFPMKNVGLSAGLLGMSYARASYKGTDRESFKTSGFSAGLTNQLNLRVFYVIGKGSKAN